MADVRRRPLKQTRLQQLASEARLPATPSQPPVRDDHSRVTFLGDSHGKEARDMLLWRRTWDAEYKSSSLSFSSKSKEPIFGYDEVNRAIKAIVNENGSPGLVEALLDLRGEKKGSMWDKVKGRDLFSWTELMSVTIWNHCYDMLRLLASRADGISLNSVLPLALRSQDLLTTRILLERGADLADYHAEFMTIMTGSNNDMAELLICSPRPPCHRCRSDALVVAARKGSPQLASLLVQRGLDADWQDWAAMRSAIQNRQIEIVLAIVSGPNPPRPSSLDAAVSLLYQFAGSDANFTLKLAEVLLCAGAQGDKTAGVLIAVARNKQVELLDLLISHGGSVDFHEGEAIRNAALEKDTQILTRLLRGKPSPQTLSKVVQSSQKALLADLRYSKDVIAKLLSAGLRGEAVDQFLLQVVLLAGEPGRQSQDPVLYMDSIELTRMLVDGNNIDVNFNNAQSLRAAAGIACLDILRLLLAKSPTENSLSAAFVEATKMPMDNPKRLEVMKTLLDAGAGGMAVDQALISAAQQGRRALEETKLLLLVASVDYNHGEALKAAVSGRNIEQLDLLLERRPTAATLRYVWDFAAGLDDISHQYDVYKRLLEVDSSVAPLDRELVAIVTKGGATQKICELLLEHGASVESNEGLALTAAVNAQNMAALQLLLERKPPASALRSAAQSAWLLRGQTRIEYGRVLLSYGVEQIVLDGGLLAAVSEEGHSMDLIAMLLDFNASPEFKHGESITKAVEKGDLELLTTLVAKVAHPENLQNALCALLTQFTWETNTGLALLSCLLAHEAKGPWIDRAFVQSCTTYNSNAWKILIDHVSSVAVLTDALKAIVSQDVAWLSPNGLTLVETLLSHGASGVVLGPAFIQAASVFNLQAVLLLQGYVHDVGIFTLAWAEATLTNDDWLDESSLPVLEVLLGSGANADVDFALVQTVTASSGGQELVGLVDLLLQHGANPNHNNGQPLRLAAGNGCPALIQLLCQNEHEPSAETIWLAFFDIITGRARDDPTQVLACVRNLVECSSAILDLNSAPDGMDLPLIQILTLYANSPDLVQYIVQAGADVGSVAVCPMLLAGPDDWRPVGNHDKRRMSPAGLQFSEELPALLWALMRPNAEVQDSVIEALVDLGADIDHATPHLRFTALILAAKQGRTAIVDKLLLNGAARDVTDNYENTALLYASRHGYNDCVRRLLRQRTIVNDGSLHEAARNLHAETVGLLIHAGHNSNFSSEMHGDRTPLGELCLLADGRASERRLEETLQALASGGADSLRGSGSMSMLPIFMALANNDPKPIVEKLIPNLIYNDLPRPEVIFERDQLAYSPTMYLKKLVLPSAGHAARANVKRAASAEQQQGRNRSTSPYPADTSLEVYDTPDLSRAFHVSLTTVYNELLTLLLRHGAKDRFYYTGTELVQPVDMTGAPDSIAKAEATRRERMVQLRASSGNIRQQQQSPPPPRPPKPRGVSGGGGGNADELHMWGGSTTSQSPPAPTGPSLPGQMQHWRVTEEQRQVADRRALAELVNAHLAQQVELRREAARLQVEARNRARLDGQELRTEWMARQAPGSGRRVWEMTTQWLKNGREARLLELDRARERAFIDSEERRLARRPEGGGAVDFGGRPDDGRREGWGGGQGPRSAIINNGDDPKTQNLSVAVAELAING